ncbi:MULTISPECIES: hemolysin family protein [Planococcus]|uniref:Transporter associated domain protein n=1 Tax=Planococcus faecalis TaxID=1598147 RepID=A0ABM6ISN5_9BACL|nr:MULTISPECIES: hemolysin family protein [Planococcus]AQU79596.1 transporter associated domain protein [Planococcus faecalis]MDJ0331623.1 hemolysin family protein [Planococcus sp. S3-L1]
MDSILILNLVMVALLIGLTALFVGSEFSIIRVRMSRIDQLVSEGHKNAILTKKIISNLDYYLSACQLGITVTALGLGWLGEPTVERLLHPVFENFGIEEPTASIFSFIIAFTVITFLHVVIGELAPKTLAIQYAEKMAFVFARPLYLFGVILAPFIWLMNGSARLLLRTFGIEPAEHEQAHSEEELKIIMTKSYHSGEINQTELSYMQNIFSFDERLAKDIMLPRTQMETISLEMSHNDLMEIVRDHQYTRYPVTEKGDKDDILGFINVKEMLTNYTYLQDLNDSIVVHDIPFVHDMAPIQDVLLKMQKEHVHMAIVVDEYGGTAGVITMEDILEEIVGEIRDEFDEDERDEIKAVDINNYLLNGRVLLSDLEDRFAIEFDDSEDVDTIGGWIQLKNTDIGEGESVEMPSHTITVREMENHQIIRVLLTRNTEMLETE